MTHPLPDTDAFIASLPRLSASLPAGWSRNEAVEATDATEAAGEIIITRAPGRLDLMGGIADYSGSLVLQLPILDATHVALRRLASDRLQLASFSSGQPARFFEMSLAEFSAHGQPIDYRAARERFARNPADHWAAYAAGAFLVLGREMGARFDRGAQIIISSQVPEGKGVSSSAALEVAVMQAIAAAYGIEIAPPRLAFLCQRVENLVAGAPCGVMDQMASACGEADRLVAILCQPGEIKGTIEQPEQLRVWGIDSGIRHSVGGADYATVRTAAFMGYRMIAGMAGLKIESTNVEGRVRIEDPRWGGYLANLTPEEFDRAYASALPREMRGADFLARYGGITDEVTSVDPERSYPVLQATRHPVDEHARVRLFAETLEGWREAGGSANEREAERRAGLLGRLMYESHESYSACGLGSSGTDEIVRLVRASSGLGGGLYGKLYGAKITGGGCGGTVAILGGREAEPAIRSIAEEYARSTGHQATIISGSSPGAIRFGHFRIPAGS